ncbi:MAG: aldehyde dehydrogenase family protein [Myxococcota bacterium]
MKLSKRKQQLKGLQRFLKEHREDIAAALASDLGKPPFEAYAIEIGPLQSELSHCLKNLDQWSRPIPVSTPITHWPASSWVQYEPLGKVLVISPWNYPLQLALTPWINAVAAGNSVTLKPSEYAPQISHLLNDKLPNFVQVEVFEGGPEVTQKLLKQPWDHIMFTGSGRVGKMVAEQASKSLIPVTLELGGKCPCIVDQNADLTMAAKRIAWGKFINSGQTCVAPDYLLVHESIAPKLVQLIKDMTTQFFGQNISANPDYGRIINDKHVERLAGLLSGGKITFGGEHSATDRYFAPTLLEQVNLQHPVMEEEIFGPILPIITFKTLDDVITLINKKPKPLAIYYFGKSKSEQHKLSKATASGAVCINETLSYVGMSTLPFGGVGESGYGSYHGEWGFRRFSYPRAYHRRAAGFDIPFRYPPYGKLALKIANWFQK